MTRSSSIKWDCQVKICNRFFTKVTIAVAIFILKKECTSFNFTKKVDLKGFFSFTNEKVILNEELNEWYLSNFP